MARSRPSTPKKDWTDFYDLAEALFVDYLTDTDRVYRRKLHFQLEPYSEAATAIGNYFSESERVLSTASVGSVSTQVG